LPATVTALSVTERTSRTLVVVQYIPPPESLEVLPLIVVLTMVEFTPPGPPMKKTPPPLEPVLFPLTRQRVIVELATALAVGFALKDYLSCLLADPGAPGQPQKARKGLCWLVPSEIRRRRTKPESGLTKVTA